MTRRISLETLKGRIVDACDPDDICDRLALTVEELLEAFEERLLECRDEFAELEEMDDGED